MRKVSYIIPKKWAAMKEDNDKVIDLALHLSGGDHYRALTLLSSSAMMFEGGYTPKGWEKVS